MPLTAADAQRGQATPATALVEIGQQRMLQDEVLDLFRGDLLAAPVNQVLLASGDDVVAGVVLPHQIA